MIRAEAEREFAWKRLPQLKLVGPTKLSHATAYIIGVPPPTPALVTETSSSSSLAMRELRYIFVYTCTARLCLRSIRTREASFELHERGPGRISDRLIPACDS
jgi:hypothetical protein